MKGAELGRVTDKLNRLSREQFAPLPTIEQWPDELNADRWCMSPELMGAYRSPLWSTLPEEQRRRLAFWELVNFFSLNIHGERFLLAGLAEQLYGRQHDPSFSYLHHFIDEENKHLNLFGTFCLKYAGKIYPDRKLSFARQYVAGESEFLFFARVLVFEEIVDYYNVKMAGDQRLVEVVREMNRIHHADEVRHLAYGRLFLGELLQRHGESWGQERREAIGEYVADFLKMTLREYYNPGVYADAGFDDPYAAAELAFESSAELRAAATARVTSYLTELGVLRPSA